MSSQLDQLDQQLLAALRDDGRRSITALAEHLHLSRSAVHARLDRLEADGVLHGFAPVVDPAKVGGSIAAFVLLSAGPGSRLELEPLRAQLHALPHVEYAALVTGDADVLLLVRADGLDQLRAFLLDELRTVTGLRGTLTLLVLDEVIRRPFLLPGE